MQHQTPLRRLLDPRTASEVLHRFTPFIGSRGVVAILDGGDQTYATSSSGVAQGSVREEDWDYHLPLDVDTGRVGVLVADVDGLPQSQAEAALHLLHWALTWMLERGMESRSLARETLQRYREINLLYTIGQTIGASLDADEIPDLILDEAARVIQAESGLVLLYENGLGLRTRSAFGPEFLQKALDAIVQHKARAPAAADTSYIWTPDQLASNDSVLLSALVAPLCGGGQNLGFVILGRERPGEVFSADDDKLLGAITSQAAVAMENAKLFSDVRDQRDAMAELTTFMDNVFTSIASGVITTDIEGKTITMINRAAEEMLGVLAANAMGRSMMDALPAIARPLCSLIDRVKARGEPLVDHELTLELPGRGRVVLRLSLSPLKDNRSVVTGTTIVIDDMTEQHKLAARARRIRQTFEEYVAPSVVERLLSDQSTARLGGTRREVTTLFADIRGFTTFSEGQQPETLVEVLNQYLSLAADVILSEEGTLDKYYGDGVMAVFNAPLAQTDHTLRAVRSALMLRDAVVRMHPQLPEPHRLQFGIGITSGMAVIGSIGSTTMKNYTAIGDCVNLASRLQRSAAPGEIFLSGDAYRKVASHVKARDLGMVEIRGHVEPIQVFEVRGLR